MELYKKYIIANAIIFLIFAVLMFAFFLPLLKKLNFGQSIRSLGPKKHLKKTGTPTMGGIVILICILIFYTLLIVEFKKIFHIDIVKSLFIIIPIVFYGIIGFIDDYLIVIKKKNDGIKPSIKFLLQLIIAASIYFIYLSIYDSNNLNFFGILIDLKFIYGIFIIFLLVGTTNATNLTDGIDGLLSICSIISYTGFGIIGIFKNEIVVVILSFTVVISLLAFLIFNLPKAKIFMGNVGSLLLGAGLVMMSILLHVEILLFFMGFIYVIETISVILQVWFFKKSRGERLFKMTPIHHHLELSNFSEIEIDITLGTVQLIMVVIGIWLAVMFF
ncbi:MAG: phospho-N-acetylmuramoyl-pentapeptide-transferase [Bacilli bacterium]|nr:phospho-N-acetylmuramoyl-pentapeptide-transferase [Bacilli bacterium]